MKKEIISKRVDRNGRCRFYVLPIRSEAGFKDLMKFITQEFECEFDSLREGPGTLVQSGVIDGQKFCFVLSDSTGAQFYAENDIDSRIAERISIRLEDRIREIM